MKSFLLVVFGIVIGLAVAGGCYTFRDAVLRGKERRFIAAIRAVTNELERYRTAHTEYPVACDAKALFEKLGPDNMVSKFGESWTQYCSDGQRYVLAFVPFGGGAYGTAYGAPLLAVNNRLVAWPNAGSSAIEGTAIPGGGTGSNP